MSYLQDWELYFNVTHPISTMAMSTLLFLKVDYV